MTHATKQTIFVSVLGLPPCSGGWLRPYPVDHDDGGGLPDHDPDRPHQRLPPGLAHSRTSRPHLQPEKGKQDTS